MKYLPLVLVLLLGTVCAQTMPFEEKDCGTIGNVLAIAGHVRDEGQTEDKFKAIAAEALAECRKANGVDGCSVRTPDQQKFVNDAFDFLWNNPKVDGIEFATEFYHRCTAQAGKAS
jgi:hypothetical protein